VRGAQLSGVTGTIGADGARDPIAAAMMSIEGDSEQEPRSAGVRIPLMDHRQARLRVWGQATVTS
jgi:hypothetical protein